MANGHTPNKPAGQGSMAQPHTAPARTSTANTAGEPPVKSVIARGKHTPGIGGSKKS